MSEELAHKPKVCIGIITYGKTTEPYLGLFREALAKQTFRDFQLLVHDNTDDNVGFGAGYNILLERARGFGASYFFIVNPDLILEDKALEILVRELDNNLELASVAPKLRRWDFSSNTFSKFIDSCGLKMSFGLGFFDLGQGQEDLGQHDNAQIIGPSGAAGLYRIEALEKVSEDNGCFDENFFMYKEDCDLAYRFYLNNLKTKLVPRAIGYHDRTATGGALLDRFRKRRTRSRLVNEWSFTNQHLLFIKYWRRQNFTGKLGIVIRAGLMILNAILFEQYLFSCYKEIHRLKQNLKRY